MAAFTSGIEFTSRIPYDTSIADPYPFENLAEVHALGFGRSYDPDAMALNYLTLTSPTEPQKKDLLERIVALYAVIDNLNKSRDAVTQLRIRATREVMDEMITFVEMGSTIFLEKGETKTQR